MSQCLDTGAENLFLKLSYRVISESKFQLCHFNRLSLPCFFSVVYQSTIWYRFFQVVITPDGLAGDITCASTALSYILLLKLYICQNDHIK
jgi:hypothetical protein